MRGINIVALAAAVSLLPSLPVLAADPADEATVNAKDRIVCKRAQRTGTRFKKETCKTVAQWEAMAEQHRRDLSETVNRPQVEIRRDQ